MYTLLRSQIFESVETDQREDEKNREDENHFFQKGGSLKVDDD